MATPNNVPHPGTPDVERAERQPLLHSSNNNHNGFGNGMGGGVGGGAQARSHLPTALDRRLSAHDHQQRRDNVRKCWRLGMLAILLVLLSYVAMTLFELISGRSVRSPYHHLKGSCDHVQPVSLAEFEERQANLSQTLIDLKADAYIAEPGTNMKYFSNIRWSQSERPFLLVVQAKRDETGQVLTKTTLVAPAFEASRARQGLMPGSSISIKTWEEGGSAYKVVKEVLETPWAGPDEDDLGRGKKPKELEQIYIDPDMRQFVSHGLSSALQKPSRQVLIANRAVALLRMQKTAHEVEILRCVSQTTVNVIRAVKSQIHLGSLESEVQGMLTRAYAEAGLEYEANGSLVLFGSDAALPHGSGNDTRLEKGRMVLIDSGARLHGYLSDITRTFWVGRGGSKEKTEELNKVWGIVKQAQNASLSAIRPGVSASSIDKAARQVISDKGLGSRFTHRLGHGLGMDGHEAPYLNIGNTDTALKAGMVFTVEPGVYVEGEYGIRLEDVVLVTEKGYEILSGDLAESPSAP